MQKESEERLLRKTYSEIINGFSIQKFRNSNVYIRHSSTLDNLETDFIYTEYYKTAIERGYPSEEERLISLGKDNSWSKDDELEVSNIKNSIKGLYTSKRKMFRIGDINVLNNQIKEQEKILIEKITKRELLIGSTAENFTRKRVDACFISQCFFKDRELNKLWFSEQEFDELYSSEVAEIYNLYYQTINLLSEDNIKKISIREFFQNVYQLADNVYEFFGKPIANLTYYQIQLCAYGAFFKQILFGENRPPEHIATDPEKLEDWHFGRTNAEEEIKRIGKDNDNESGNLVGLSSEDRKFLGYDQIERVPMFQKIKDAGGELSMEEIIKIDTGEG